MILKTEWDILDSYLSLMLSCLDGLNSSGKTSETVKFGGHISLSSAARLTQNLLSIVLLQIKDPTNPEVKIALTEVAALTRFYIVFVFF